MCVRPTYFCAFHRKMQLAHVKLAIFVVAALALAFWCTEAEATYRKPPFNGSIFGKRGTVTAGEKSSIVFKSERKATGVLHVLFADVDNAGKALSAMCEIASEACQTWFSSQEK